MKLNKLIYLLLIVVILIYQLLTGPTKEVDYSFRNEELLNEHYNNHGIEMGFSSKEEYEQAANEVINNSSSLHKKEKEDNDDVYYLEDTNEFVIVSKDGYIRTYFLPERGKDYYLGK